MNNGQSKYGLEDLSRDTRTSTLTLKVKTNGHPRHNSRPVSPSIPSTVPTSSFGPGPEKIHEEQMKDTRRSPENTELRSRVVEKNTVVDLVKVKNGLSILVRVTWEKSLWLSWTPRGVKSPNSNSGSRFRKF